MKKVSIVNKIINKILFEQNYISFSYLIFLILFILIHFISFNE
jgi:hypothetical protein